MQNFKDAGIATGIIQTMAIELPRIERYQDSTAKFPTVERFYSLTQHFQTKRYSFGVTS